MIPGTKNIAEERCLLLFARVAKARCLIPDFLKKNLLRAQNGCAIEFLYQFLEVTKRHRRVMNSERSVLGIVGDTDDIHNASIGCPHTQVPELTTHQSVECPSESDFDTSVVCMNEISAIGKENAVVTPESRGLSISIERIDFVPNLD